jgi:hypothetical protein
VTDHEHVDSGPNQAAGVDNLPPDVATIGFMALYLDRAADEVQAAIDRTSGAQPAVRLRLTSDQAEPEPAWGWEVLRGLERYFDHQPEEENAINYAQMPIGKAHDSRQARAIAQGWQRRFLPGVQLEPLPEGASAPVPAAASFRREASGVPAYEDPLDPTQWTGLPGVLDRLGCTAEAVRWMLREHGRELTFVTDAGGKRIDFDEATKAAIRERVIQRLAREREGWTTHARLVGRIADARAQAKKTALPESAIWGVLMSAGLGPGNWIIIRASGTRRDSRTYRYDVRYSHRTVQQIFDACFALEPDTNDS